MKNRSHTNRRRRVKGGNKRGEYGVYFLYKNEVTYTTFNERKMF
jgi:hypothetical protein